MSTRSDIFIALKPELHEKVKHLPIFAAADEHFVHDEGHAYIFEQISWPLPGTDALQDALYEALGEHDNEMGDNHLILEACHDYPESSDGDSGSWYDNPWNARREVSVSIKIDHPTNCSQQ